MTRPLSRADQWAHVRRCTENASILRHHNAPAVIVNDELRKARDGKLRLWGWTGPMPSFDPSGDSV